MSYALEPDIFKLAKDRSLADFLEKHLSVKGKKAGSKFRIDSCPHCGESSAGSQKVVITDDRYWFCHGCDNHGSIIDAAMLLCSYDTPLEAAQYITTGNHTALAISSELAAKLRKEKSDCSLARAQAVEVLYRATRNCWSPDVEHFLTNTRCFSRGTVLEAHKRGLIGLIPSFREGGLQFLKEHLGIELLERAKLYDAEKDRSWLVSYPLIQFLPGHSFAEVRRIWMPTPKPGGDPVKKSLGLGIPAEDQFPYYWQSASIERCLFTEGLMDVLAAVSHGYPNLILAVPGISKWRIEWFIDLHQRGVKIFDLAYDNDIKKMKNPGQFSQAEIAKKLDLHTIPWANASPPEGDINDQLIKAVRKRTTLTT